MAAPRFPSVVVSAIGLVSQLVLGIHGGDVELLRGLSLVGVLVALVDPKIAHQVALERPAGNHAAHRLLDDALGELAVEHLVSLALLDAAGVPGMAVVGLVLPLSPGED